MTATTVKLRSLLAGPGMLVAPGAYDGITGMLAERVGFSAVYMTGAGTAAAQGFPDYGLISLTEMTANVERISRSISVPLIADADTGYGNELNVVRTIREFERHGAAGVHLEDQTFPKRCGHLDNKQLVPLDEYERKIAAAAHARTDPNFLIIARTDARGVLGFEEAVRRANAALAKGADMAFVEAPQTVDEVNAIPKLVKGPCLFNMVKGGKTPDTSVATAQAAGYKLAIVPALLLAAAMSACEAALEGLRDQGSIPNMPRNLSVIEIFERVGLRAWDEVRSQVSG